jgi:gamma-glutamylcyclotransferase (GGCT)/AIG2-like uncharacterized protein YtfP
MEKTNMGHKLFVYGTLKQGFSNNRYLETAKFHGPNVTEDSTFTMVSLGFCPAVSSNGYHAISGELFEVDDETLNRIDMLEGNGRFYNREEVLLRNGEVAWMYMMERGGFPSNSPSIEIEDGIASWEGDRPTDWLEYFMGKYGEADASND